MPLLDHNQSLQEPLVLVSLEQVEQVLKAKEKARRRREETERPRPRALLALRARLVEPARRRPRPRGLLGLQRPLGRQRLPRPQRRQGQLVWFVGSKCKVMVARWLSIGTKAGIGGGEPMGRNFNVGLVAVGLI